MKIKRVAWMLTLPIALGAQTPARPVDSLGLGAAIAARLIAERARDSAWVVVIDTNDSRWNAYARRALLARAPERLRTLTDSAARVALQFGVLEVEVIADTIRVLTERSQCFGPDAYAFSRLYWRFRESRSGWQEAPGGRDQVVTGHGVCTPFNARKPPRVPG